MDKNNLHTSFLENEFGPIKVGILKQENDLRIVHLYDGQLISRTVGLVQFKETGNKGIRDAHQKILKGEPLGNTLVESDIDFEKTPIQKFVVNMPEWLLEDFRTTEKKTLALYSRIFVKEEGRKEAFLYAEIIEVIPPDIVYLFQSNGELKAESPEGLKTLLDFANISAS